MGYNSELYQQVILDHNKNPRNYQELVGATHQCDGRNPLCGDHITVYLKLNNASVIEEISFTGSGCAISKSSASLMTMYAKGKTVKEIQVAFDEFHKMVLGELDTSKENHHLGKLKLFEGVKEYSARVKCATLGWHALSCALKKDLNASTEEELSLGLKKEENLVLDQNREELDLSGVKCPINFVKVKVKLSKMNVGEQLAVILDNGDPIKNVPESVALEGHKILEKLSFGETKHRIVIEKVH